MSTPNDPLDALFAQVPEVNCKGLCTRACGPLLMSRAEEQRIIAADGSAPAALPNNQCDKLRNGRCTVYADRPLICRLYGAVRKMQCPHGCRPSRGFLTDAKAHALLDAAERIVGPGSSLPLEITAERLAAQK